jgi:hypothetical protein
MKRFVSLLSVLVFTAIAFTQIAGYQGRLSRDDQERFDGYYQHWLQSKRVNDREDVIRMERRMQEIMERYNIPASVPYDAIASSESWDKGSYRQYRGRFSLDDQARYDSYYERWLDYKRANNREETLSMEKGMQEVMRQYQIPITVPYDALTNFTWGTYAGGFVSPWREHLEVKEQGRFDGYYRQWLQALHAHDGKQVRTMEIRMRDLMRLHNIPDDVPFDQVASAEVARPDTSYYAELRILNATYGIQDHSLDVTTRLQGLMQNDRLSVKVSNESMGGDPAPEHKKLLEVTYSWQGRERRVSVAEGETLTIP